MSGGPTALGAACSFAPARAAARQSQAMGQHTYAGSRRRGPECGLVRTDDRPQAVGSINTNTHSPRGLAPASARCVSVASAAAAGSPQDRRQGLGSAPSHRRLQLEGSNAGSGRARGDAGPRRAEPEQGRDSPTNLGIHPARAGNLRVSAAEMPPVRGAGRTAKRVAPQSRLRRAWKTGWNRALPRQFLPGRAFAGELSTALPGRATN